jgi:hypothetical protein
VGEKYCGLMHSLLLFSSFNKEGFMADFPNFYQFILCKPVCFNTTDMSVCCSTLRENYALWHFSNKGGIHTKPNFHFLT